MWVPMVQYVFIDYNCSNVSKKVPAIKRCMPSKR